MTDILLALSMIVFFIIGYFVMKNIDCFICENEKNIRNVDRNRYEVKKVLKKCSGEAILIDKFRK
ncbi:MAG: hypothetical protein K6B41_02135 [Butyrivibrio sp.]|nr:hypothetical protein [Butyrivibrio sp.]